MKTAIKLWMVLLIIGLLISLIALSASAQTNIQFIRGTMAISYNSRITSGKADIYKMDIRVSDSARFHGTIANVPVVLGTFGSVSQPSSMNYDLTCDVVNPANPAQTRAIGKLVGKVPVSPEGVYSFDRGTMQIMVNSIGKGNGFDSKFGGAASGRPLIKKSTGLFSKLSGDIMKLTKTVNGKTVSMNVTNYDKMSFSQHVMAAGPVSDSMYPSATVNGEMLYDYDRSAWHFRSMSVVYQHEGKMMADKLTGNIRWVEAPNRKANGEGQYEFDIRVNEPPPNEAAAFGAGASEASFFEVDTSMTALVGTMKYKDAMSSGTVTASAVTIDLVGNKLTKQQCMNLCKLVLLSCIVPINAE